MELSGDHNPILLLFCAKINTRKKLSRIYGYPENKARASSTYVVWTRWVYPKLQFVTFTNCHFPATVTMPSWGIYIMIVLLCSLSTLTRIAPVLSLYTYV